MRPTKPEPVRLGDGHCCQCTDAHGEACGHTGEILLCHQHLTIRGLTREPWIPWWRWSANEAETARDPDVSWDTLAP